VPFLEKLTKKNKIIMNFIIYIICNYQYDYQKPPPQHARNDYTLKTFIQHFGKFVKSCGVYGEGPYLYVDNGIGDIPQAFTRIASIYHSTYILHPKIEITRIEAGQPLKIYTNLYPEGFI
jgi:RAB protein geranylgeranyltransferase component A